MKNVEFTYKTIPVYRLNKLIGQKKYIKSNEKTLKYFSNLVGDKGIVFESASKGVKFRIFNSTFEQVKNMFPDFTVELDYSTLYDYNRKSDTYQFINKNS